MCSTTSQSGECFSCSFPVIYLGSITLKNSLRLVEYDVRNQIAKEAIARVREASKSRAMMTRKVCLCAFARESIWMLILVAVVSWPNVCRFRSSSAPSLGMPSHTL